MNSLSFTNYKDKAYDFIKAFFSWKNNLSDIWQTGVLKNMLRDGVTFQQNCVRKVIRYTEWTMHKLKLRLVLFSKEVKFSVLS